MDNKITLLQDFLDFFDFIQMVICSAHVYLRRTRKRRFWVREIYLERDVAGLFASTSQKLKNDPEQFFIATRMSPSVFDSLCNKLAEKLEKNSARAISPNCRLFLTLIYLAHGPTRQYLSLSFRMSVSVVRRIVLETCQLIWDELANIYISLPNRNKWQQIAQDFNTMWNMPNCVGAIDGKHIALTCPPNSGSQFYNYKGTYSIVLLGVCDANYNFIVIDVGAYGSQSDGGILNYSEFGRKLLNESLDLPTASTLPNSNAEFPFYLVGDAAFLLKPYLMRPYPGLLLSDEKNNFNKRLSRARRTIENAFGILTARWRILRGTLNMSPESAEKIVCATVVLHNYVKTHDVTYCPPDFVDRNENGEIVEGLWRKEVSPLKTLSRLSSNNSSREAFHLRDKLCSYLFCNKI